MLKTIKDDKEEELRQKQKKELLERIWKLSKETPVKEYKPYILEKKYKKREPRYWVHKFRMFWNPDKLIKVRMATVIGDVLEFYVPEKDHGFYWRGGFYYIDGISKYYIPSIRMYGYDYHENFCLPLKWEIPVKQLTEDIELSPDTEEVSFGMFPRTFKAFMKAQLGEELMKSGKWTALLQTMFILVVVHLIAFVVFIILFMYKTGMFEQAKNIV